MAPVILGHPAEAALEDGRERGEEARVEGLQGLGDHPAHARRLHGLHVAQSLAGHLGREGRDIECILRREVSGAGRDPDRTPP
eukprot:902582-Pyramimonas_sp.AAC.1